MAQILVVAFSGHGRTLVNILEGAEHDVRGAGSGPQAFDMLAGYSPDLLISELRLGAFNGLHLVLRHRSSHPAMRAIILDSQYDPVLAGDARHYGATYLVEPIGEAQLLAAVSRELAGGNPQRRWPRTRPLAPLVVSVDERPTRVLDLSYGGLKLETEKRGTFPGPFHVVVPGSGLAIEARPVWTHPAPSGTWWCGAEVFTPSSRSEEAWRQFVDSLQVPA